MAAVAVAEKAAPGVRAARVCGGEGEAAEKTGTADAEETAACAVCAFCVCPGTQNRGNREPAF
ncbi:MAG TPA: hypothetical protein VHO71_05840 [Caproiciproducens sp.]|nr:hypothetical protein [Caproiciproducens sp.]